jgi:hypothetical protein
MLGVTTNKILGPADKLLRKVAESAEVGGRFIALTSRFFRHRRGCKVASPCPIRILAARARSGRHAMAAADA